MNGGVLDNEANWENGQGQLADQIGSPNNMSKEGSVPPYHFFVDYIEVIDKTEYDMPTSKWFIHNDEGEFGYGLPSGTMEPSASYTIKLFPRDNKRVLIDRDVRIQLTTRNQTYEKSELIMEDLIHLDTISGEEEIYSSKLPGKENVLYVLSVEILDEQHQVEDTMVSMIYVPIREINAKLTTDKAVYAQADEKAIIAIENDGPTFLSVGEEYTIEKKVTDRWKVVPLNIAFPEIGILVNVDATFDQTIAMNELTAGEYRVIKTIHADGLDVSATLAAEFIVE